MNTTDRRILSELADQLRQRYTEARIWAYGSGAKGTADWDSDFDICIVLDKVTPEKERFIRDIAWEIGFENDRVITTFIIDQERFEHGPMSESSLVANILSEGVSA
jgi:predicted nucleotidyltransferase